MYQIIDKKKLNKTVELMKIKAPFVARKCEAGQFIILRVDKEGERVPLTIADFDREEESVTIIYQIVGYSTKKLSQRQIGDFIEDFVGPLGQAAPLHNVKNVLGIGGGVGIAPLYPQLKKMREMGANVEAILGGRNEELIILQNEMEGICSHVYYATDDGSKGMKGFVTDQLKALLDEGKKYDLVIAIGPLIMMKNICQYTKELNIPTNVSLNPIMIDGTGMCGGCRVTVGGQIKFACVDGPDFDGHAVDFDEAMRRQEMYKEEEHKCRLALEG